MQRTMTIHPFPKPRTARDEIPHFIAKCPVCACWLVNRLEHALRDASDATGGYMDAHGCRYPDPKLEALESRAERIGELLQEARLYRAINREHKWGHVHPSFDCSEKSSGNTDSFCPTNMPDALDTPLLITEEYAPNNFHTRRLRQFVHTLRVGL
jgi:hypothetical protein